MRGQEISNNDDIIDSRDVIGRLEELESELSYLEDELTEAENVHDKDKAGEAGKEWYEENGEELKVLRALAEEGEGYSEWEYGATLIRDSFFTDYARDLAEEIGCIKKSDRWPYTCIDWEKAADELKHDYVTLDYDGVEYWIRA